MATIPLPPWGYRLEDGIPAGICYEWANAIAERMGRPIENHIIPMARLYKLVEFGKVDFSIMLRTSFSESISVPVVNVGIPFRTIVLSRKGKAVKSYAELKGLRLSVARGLKVGGTFAEQKGLTIVPSMDYAHSMLQFKAGRVDAIVGTQQSLLYNAYKTGINPAKAFDEPFELAKLEGWVQASKEYVEREGLEELKKAAESLIADGTFRRIYQKYQFPSLSRVF